MKPIDLSLRLFAAGLVWSLAAHVQAITVSQADGFQDGTAMSWTGADTTIAADLGPTGAGDDSLRVSSTLRFTAYNQTQWSGNWTAAGVTQIAMDVRHNNDSALTLWIGISRGLPMSKGTGDTYVSNLSATVPNDDQWHTIVFDVKASDFSAAPSHTDASNNPAAALAAVTQFRILHNPLRRFIGAYYEGTVLLDNIHAVPEPSTLGLASLVGTAALCWLERRQSFCVRSRLKNHF